MQKQQKGWKGGVGRTCLEWVDVNDKQKVEAEEGKGMGVEVDCKEKCV